MKGESLFWFFFALYWVQRCHIYCMRSDLFRRAEELKGHAQYLIIVTEAIKEAFTDENKAQTHTRQQKADYH